MLSVVIPTRNDERSLVPTLAALVPGAADGLVRDVTVADGGSSDATLEIADLAGCHAVAGGPALGGRLDAAARRAKGPWLMFLEPGVVLEESWRHEVRALIDALERSGDEDARAAVFQFALDGFGGRVRLSERLARLKGLLTGLPRPAQGLLINKSFYETLGGYRPLNAMVEADLIRRIGARRIERMRTRAIAPADPAAVGGSYASRARDAVVAGLLMLRVPPSVVARLYG